VSGSDPEINHDRFGRCPAADLYLEAVELYENIKTEKIVVDTPFSDKMRLFLQVLHYMYPEWDDTPVAKVPYNSIPTGFPLKNGTVSILWTNNIITLKLCLRLTS